MRCILLTETDIGMHPALLHLLLAPLVLASPRADPFVYTNRGLIKGLQASDGDYSMFLGIPYARVNRSNPFASSLPQPDFEGIFEAYDDSAICPQIDQFSDAVAGTLDCLNLNVYVPNKASRQNALPVLVWIHGGRFQYGFAGRYVHGPRYLVKHDIILVTINYRVGPYGFMCLDTPEIPGNQGLKDQLRALRWINENIEAFGGDRDKVTISGSSAGGVSVDFLLMSEQEKLFDKVIIQSGTALRHTAVQESDREIPIKLAENLGFQTDDTEEAVAFLSAIDPALIIASVRELDMNFILCVEKDFEGVEKFLSKHPISNNAIPKAKSIPILIGYTDDESLIFYGNGIHGNHSFDIFKLNMDHFFDLNNNEEQVTLVRQFYVGDEEQSADLKWELMEFESDFTYNHPTHRSIQKYLENDGRVYHYIFSYTGGRNMAKWQKNMTEGGAAHSDEKGYLFDVSFLDEPTEEDQLMIDRITTLWTNFVKYGDPTPVTTELLPVKWIPLTKKVMYYLDIDSELTIKRRPFHRRMAFWDLFFQSNEHLLKYFERNV